MGTSKDKFLVQSVAVSTDKDFSNVSSIVRTLKPSAVTMHGTCAYHNYSGNTLSRHQKVLSMNKKSKSNFCRPRIQRNNLQLAKSMESYVPIATILSLLAMERTFVYISCISRLPPRKNPPHTPPPLRPNLIPHQQSALLPRICRHRKCKNTSPPPPRLLYSQSKTLQATS